MLRLNGRRILSFIQQTDNPEEDYVFLRMDEGTAVAQWLRCCATNRKVAGWISDGVIGIFY